ncbi:unnamed protein product [Orchesella dallaii]|uniref:RING-type domain-containing protein n=1 Tax=Orchesella dallaii TaxID=48710 RepID=A0ABP1RKL5_9HEXA
MSKGSCSGKYSKTPKMDQGKSGSQTVEPINMGVTHHADNQAMDEAEYSGLSPATASGQPDDDSPSTRRMSAKKEKAAEEALVHANSKRKVVVNKTSRLVTPRQKKLDFTPGKKMSHKQIDACEKKDVRKTQLTTVRQELKKAKMPVTNTELRMTSQERLQTEKEAKAIAIQAEAEQAKMAIITNIIEMELKCVICRETFINPTATDCGHTFCRFCINESQLTRPNCPTCNQPSLHATPNYALMSLLDNLASQLPAEAKEARRVQITTREEEEERAREARAQAARAQAPEEIERDAVERNLVRFRRLFQLIHEELALMQ